MFPDADNLKKNLPPENRWAEIQGTALFPVPDNRQALVSVQGVDHEGNLTSIWVDVPNAMYLLQMLQQIQQRFGEKLPTSQPAATKPHP